MSYALTRLVRGLGSSRATSRTGFYTTLTAYLKTNPDIRVDELMKIMDAELHAVNSSQKSVSCYAECDINKFCFSCYIMRLEHFTIVE